MNQTTSSTPVQTGQTRLVDRHHPIEPMASPKKQPLAFFRGGKIGPAVWSVASGLSLLINIVLIVIIILLGKQLFTIKKLVNDQLIGGLYGNFVSMDEAHIKTTIPVKTNVPAKFDLPLKTKTIVKLTADTPISSAKVSLYGGFVTIANAPTDIVLPAGTELPVELDLTVPVDQQIPVELMVNVDIPLNQTELHQPFTGLQQVLGPYYNILNQMPNSWAEVFCGQPASGFCQRLFP